MKITIIGTGYVGLVTGTCLAESGNQVICVDNNLEKLEMLEKHIIPIYEPGLEEIFIRNIHEQRLSFTSDLVTAVKTSEVVFLCLPTPPKEDGSADLQYVLSVAENIGAGINQYKIIVNKSTVPVGTTKLVKDAILKYTNVEFDVISNPEFLREGSAIVDFMKPDRIVVGTQSEIAKEKMQELYDPFLGVDRKLIFMDEASSEMTKYAANSFLATKISFINEVANLCEKVGADVDHVYEGMGTDSRIGKKFLKSGIGYGGSCFPKDVSALHKIAKAHDYDFKILKAVTEVNDFQKHSLVLKIKDYFGEDLTGLKFAVWGLAFKPDTDDIRESPSLSIIQELLAAGAAVEVYDPEAMPSVQKYTDLKIAYGAQPYDILDHADALVVATDWNEFKTPDYDKIQSLLNSKVIFDGRNIYHPKKMHELGFYYASIGRVIVKP
jgi:UDPglucose 6-dehydrogenase